MPVTLLCEPDEFLAGALAPLYGGASVVASLPAAALVVATTAGVATQVVVGPGVPIDEVLTFAVRINAADLHATITLLRDRVDDALRAVASKAGISEVLAMGDTNELRELLRSAKPKLTLVSNEE